MKRFILIVLSGVLMMSTTGRARDAQGDYGKELWGELSYILFGNDNRRQEAQKRLQQLKEEDFFTNAEEIDLAKAVEQEDTNRIQMLLDKGINVNTKGFKDDMTFIMWSLLKFKKGSYQYLLEHGADPNQFTTPKRRNQIYPTSIMDTTVIPEDTFWLKLALEHGGNPNAPKGNESIIFEAINNHRIDNVKLLVEAGADINYQNKISGDTPLIEALSGSRFDIAYYLLEKGANYELKKVIILSITKFKVYSYSGDLDKQVEYQKKVKAFLEAKGFNFETNQTK